MPIGAPRSTPRNHPLCPWAGPGWKVVGYVATVVLGCAFLVGDHASGPVGGWALSLPN